MAHSPSPAVSRKRESFVLRRNGVSTEFAIQTNMQYSSRMPALFSAIRKAVAENSYVVSWHADERCEKRGLTAWQLVTGLSDGRLIEERPLSRPNPSVVVRQMLANGAEVEVVWSWLSRSRKAKLVTVYFP